MINIGVIGCGYWGPNLVRNFHEVDEAEVLICCDKRQKRLDYIKKRYPSIEVTADPDELIQDKRLDAVAIATPVSTHHGLAGKALAAGKHVLVEKPLAASTDECKELIELAEKNSRKLMVGHTFEYTGAVNKMKELIEKKAIGDVFYFDSSRVNLGLFQEDINVIWDLAPHDLSIMHYVLGVFPETVMAIGQDHINPGMANIAYISLLFPGKLIGHVTVSWLAPVKFRRTVICGSQKMIVYDDIEPVDKIKIYDKGVEMPSDPEALMDKQYIYRTGDMFAPKLDTTESLKAECAHFIDCIANDRQPRSDGLSGLRVVTILEAASRSVREGGKPIEIRTV